MSHLVAAALIALLGPFALFFPSVRRHIAFLFRKPTPRPET